MTLQHVHHTQTQLAHKYRQRDPMIVAILCDHRVKMQTIIYGDDVDVRFNRSLTILIKNKFKKLFVTFAANVD